MTLEIDFLEKVKALGYSIKIDTNGSYPEKLKEMITKKLVDYIAMDIKGPKENYQEIVGVIFPMNRLEESIKVISKFPNYEFRTTIIENIHTKEKVESMLKWVKLNIMVV